MNLLFGTKEKDIEGDVKNGTQAINVYLRTNEYTTEEREKIEKDLEKYCSLDNFAVVKILKKLIKAPLRLFATKTFKLSILKS